jgi:hypothetical protein
MTRRSVKEAVCMVIAQTRIRVTANNPSVMEWLEMAMGALLSLWHPSTRSSQGLQPGSRNDRSSNHISTITLTSWLSTRDVL